MICYDFPYPKLLQYFEEISAIPRMSCHEEQIADYLVAFARDRGLPCYRDAAHNVLIDLPATAGYEDCPAILLQGHTDMVCEANAGVTHDFLKDSLELYVENGILRARNTTLGSDDGVAVAMMLYIADTPEIAHPACQCLFTSAEEIGLEGAKVFDYSKIYARRMINMDSADERQITVGCSGGIRTDAVFEPIRVVTPDAPAFCVQVGGLAGGHSGENIKDGKANSNKIMGRLLASLSEKMQFALASVNGGNKDNAIARETQAVIVTADEAKLREAVDAFSKEIAAELVEADAAFFVQVASAEAPRSVFCTDFTRKFITYLVSMQNGVIQMHPLLPDLVGYSRNMASISTEENNVTVRFSSRSANDNQLEDSMRNLKRLTELCGGTVSHRNRYPGWEYQGETPLLQAFCNAYGEVYGKKPQTIAIHAGLECGIICRALPGLDVVAFGPNSYGLHSPEEALELDSFARFADVVFRVLAKKF